MSGSGSRAALDKQQNTSTVEEVISLLERVSPERTEVITRIHQIVKTLQEEANLIHEQSLYHRLMLAVEGNRDNIIHTLQPNQLHYIAYLLINAGTGDCQTCGLYLLLDGYPLAERHTGEASLPKFEQCPLQLRNKFLDKLSAIFHDGQRDDHSRKLAGKILGDMMLALKNPSQVDLTPLWMKFDSSPDNTVLGFFAGLITHRLLSSTAGKGSVSKLVYTLRETSFSTYLEKAQSDPPKFLADISAMMKQIPITYAPQQLPVSRTQVTAYFLRSINMDTKSLASNTVLATLSPTGLTFVYCPENQCNGYFEYLEISFPGPQYINTSLHVDGANDQHLVLYIGDTSLVSKNGQKQRGDKLTISMDSSDDLSELKERLRSLIGEDKQANRTGYMSRRSSSMFIILDPIEEIARKSVNERAHDESLISLEVHGLDGVITGTLLDREQENQSNQESSHLDDAETTRASPPRSAMSQGQDQNDIEDNVVTMSPAWKFPIENEQHEGTGDFTNGKQSKIPSTELGLGAGEYIGTGYEMMTPVAGKTGEHRGQLANLQKSKNPLQTTRVESSDRSIEMARGEPLDEEHSHGLSLRKDSKRLLPNTQESLIFPLRRPKRKVYNLNSKAAVDWDEDLRPSDEVDENEPPPKRLSRVGFTSVTSLISSPFPGDEPLFQQKPKRPVRRQKPTKTKSLATGEQACARKTKRKRKNKKVPMPKPCLQLDIASTTTQQPHDVRHGDTEMTNDDGLCLTDGDENHQFSVLNGLPNLGLEVAAVLAGTGPILVDVADTSKSMPCNGDGDPAGSTSEKIHYADTDLAQSDEEKTSKVSDELNQNLSQVFEQRGNLNEGRGLTMGKRLAAALRGSPATSHDTGDHDASSIDIDMNAKIENNGSLETVLSAHSATAQDVDLRPTAGKYIVERINPTCVTDIQVPTETAPPTLVLPEAPILQCIEEVVDVPMEDSNRSDNEALNEESNAEKLRHSNFVQSSLIEGVGPIENSSHAHFTCRSYQKPLDSVPGPRNDDCTVCDTAEEEKGLTANISPCERTPTVKIDTLSNIVRANTQAQVKHPSRSTEISRTTIVDGNGSPRLFPQTEHVYQSRSRYSWPEKEPISPIAKCSSLAHSTSSEIVSQTGSFDTDLVRAFVVSREKLGIHSNNGTQGRGAISRESTVARLEYITDHSSMGDFPFNTVDCATAACLQDDHEATPSVLVSKAEVGLTQRKDRDTVDRVNNLSPGRDRVQVQPNPGQHPRGENNGTDQPVLQQTVQEMTGEEFLASNKYLLCQLEQERKTITAALEAYRRQCHRVLDQLFEAQKQQIRVCREQMERVQRHHAAICREFTDRLEANERSLAAHEHRVGGVQAWLNETE